MNFGSPPLESEPAYRTLVHHPISWSPAISQDEKSNRARSVLDPCGSKTEQLAELTCDRGGMGKGDSL